MQILNVHKPARQVCHDHREVQAQGNMHLTTASLQEEVQADISEAAQRELLRRAELHSSNSQQLPALSSYANQIMQEKFA